MVALSDSPFSSFHQKEVAQALATLLLKQAAILPSLKKAVKHAEALKNLVWQDLSSAPEEDEQRQAAIAKTCANLIKTITEPEERLAMLTVWLRLGQLYELAALVARANMVDSRRDPDKPRLPGGITDMVTTTLNVGMSPLDALARPVFEVVMTAHPTNVNDKESITALREIGKALDALRLQGGNTRPNQTILKAAITQLLTAKAIPERITSRGEHVPTNLSVYDETDLILYYLGAVYEDLPLVYGGFDRVLTRKLPEYDPAVLRLTMRFSSWGSSGDKDGNSQVTAGTTLEACIMHRYEIIHRYALELNGITPSASAPHKLKLWQSRLEAITRKLDALRHDVRAALAPITDINAETLRLESMISEDGRNEQLASLRAAMRIKRLEHFSPHIFRRFSARLKEILWELGEAPKQHFLADIQDAYDGEKDATTRAALLVLLRRVRAFSFSFARIEFRETAEEYTRVVAELLASYQQLFPQDPLEAMLPHDSYLALPEPEKTILLERLISEGKAAEIQTMVMEDIERRGAGLMYDSEDAAPITLHTLLRMELARDFPDMITANVLAECQEVSHLLEAQFLQAASIDADGKRALMGIIPLYEEPDIMEQVGEILSRAYATPIYRKHMALVAEHLFALGYGDGRPTQQVQIAHSDNTRRAGLPAARALIYHAHDLIRDAGKKAGVTTQFFEGGSNSDPFRGGIRSISATANMYDTHDFLKFTFQGGDLLNYFNYPSSTERLFARNLSHMAKTLVQKGQGAWTKEGTDEHDHPRNLKDWTKAVLPALIATRDTYRDTVFNKKAVGRFLYETRDTSGNTGSRAGARAGGKGKAQREVSERMIDPTDMRTITFSESFAHAGITPTWVGVASLEEDIRKALVVLARAQGAKETKGALELTLQDESGTRHYRISTTVHAALGEELLQDLYRKSAIFRDVADRMAFGIAMSDVEGLPRYYPALRTDAFFTGRLLPDYETIAVLLESILPLPDASTSTRPAYTHDLTRLRNDMRRRLPHLHDIMQHKGDYMRIAQEMKAAWREDRDKSTADSPPSAQHRWVMSLAHAAIDCVTHGRMPAADDPMYRKMAFPAQTAKASA